MEHREPPRIGPGDRRIEDAIEEPRGRFRLRRFDLEGNRRQIGYRRIGLVALAGVAVSTLLAYLGTWAARASVGWLAHQPQYQVPFQKIELLNEPPRWFEGGAPKFLESVRLGSREPEHVPVLNVAPDDLAAIFKKYAWVAQVTRVDYGSGRIRVELRYRQPVAWVTVRGGQQLMIDDEGTILPTDDVDLAALGRVPNITGDLADGGLAPPAATQYGEKWKSRSGPGGLEEVDARILAAGKLAGFLLREPQASDAQRSSALRMMKIIVTDFDKRGLFVTNAEDAAILWGDAPGAERSIGPSADDKWAMLRRWELSTQARFLDEGDYWDFGKTKLVHVCPRLHPNRHHPRTAAERTVGSRDTDRRSTNAG